MAGILLITDGIYNSLKENSVLLFLYSYFEICRQLWMVYGLKSKGSTPQFEALFTLGEGGKEGRDLEVLKEAK